MNILFDIKKNIFSLSNNNIDKKLIIYLFFSVSIIIISIIYQGDFISVIKIALEPVKEIQEPDRINIYIKLIKDTIILLFIFFVLTIIFTVLLNWLIKKILAIFKKQISLYKLINITIYAYFITALILAIFTSIIVLLMFAPAVISNTLITENTIYIVLIIPIITIISGLSLYIYGIKTSINTK